MKNTFLHMAVAAAINTMQGAPQQLKTIGHKITGNQGFNGFNRKQAKNKRFRSKYVSKHKPHQSKRERARRLRRYTAAWYSDANAINCGHGLNVRS